MGNHPENCTRGPLVTPNDPLGECGARGWIGNNARPVLLPSISR